MGPLEPMSESTITVAVCIVSFHAARDLPRCLAAVEGQTRVPDEIVVVDSASGDSSAAVARAELGGAGRVLEMPENRGFAGAANLAIDETESSWILLLNPDAWPRPDYLEQLLVRVENRMALRIGAVTGRLMREPTSSAARRLDSCGIELRPTWRHLDRGAGEIDRAQFNSAERVFGATGAASLFHRQALEDVAFDDGVFAPEFHSYREDAELCFRLQEREWEVLYEPAAVCIHRRRVTPRRRREIDPEINCHSLKNRYLLRAYHQDWPNLLLTFVPTLIRDLAALTWVVTVERSSLTAYLWLWRHRALIRGRRRRVMERRTSGSWAISRWFFVRSLPL